MREVGISRVRANFFTLLKEAARGETIIITRRGRPVAQLTAPEAPDREGALAAAKTLRGLRQRSETLGEFLNTVGQFSTYEEFLEYLYEP